ncbi:hypothetical protein P691DRAFT_49264 [Macrolepiota fuliginosa MF-IS2]|uniref:Uncharacterized protein n=1 Tax=Macrolepiota fuliginosa MF-IS2 TaxID=1400762 RepID=A0A9P6C4N5_9AGAR|nr:hypothetical protein P691DRAFT_49264 [Macrolepiota fuliginosa MF-IS2]
MKLKKHDDLAYMVRDLVKTRHLSQSPDAYSYGPTPPKLLSFCCCKTSCCSIRRRLSCYTWIQCSFHEAPRISWRLVRLNERALVRPTMYSRMDIEGLRTRKAPFEALKKR